MTRLDFFAGQALTGLLAREDLMDEYSGKLDYEYFAKAAARTAAALEKEIDRDPTKHRK